MRRAWLLLMFGAAWAQTPLQTEVQTTLEALPRIVLEQEGIHITVPQLPSELPALVGLLPKSFRATRAAEGEAVEQFKQQITRMGRLTTKRRLRVGRQILEPGEYDFGLVSDDPKLRPQGIVILTPEGFPRTAPPLTLALEDEERRPAREGQDFSLQLEEHKGGLRFVVGWGESRARTAVVENPD